MQLSLVHVDNVSPAIMRTVIKKMRKVYVLTRSRFGSECALCD